MLSVFLMNEDVYYHRYVSYHVQ